MTRNFITQIYIYICIYTLRGESQKETRVVSFDQSAIAGLGTEHTGNHAIIIMLHI